MKDEEDDFKFHQDLVGEAILFVAILAITAVILLIGSAIAGYLWGIKL